jgi:hypothetical protein
MQSDIDADEDIITALSLAAACTVAQAEGMSGLGDMIADEHWPPRRIALILAMAFKGTSFSKTRAGAILLAGPVARHKLDESVVVEEQPEFALARSAFAANAIIKDRATAILDERWDDVLLLAEVIDKLTELRPAPIEGDIDVSGTVVEQVDHHVAA